MVGNAVFVAKARSVRRCWKENAFFVYKGYIVRIANTHLRYEG